MARTSSFLRLSTNPVTGKTLVSQSEDKLVGNTLTHKKKKKKKLARNVAVWDQSPGASHYIVSILRRIYREAHYLPATRPGSIARGQSAAKHQRVSISDKDGNAIDTDHQ